NGDRAIIESISKDSVTVKLERTNQTVEIKVKSYEVEHIAKDDITLKANIYGLPMRLSYGITAHKSQGLSLDHVVANAKNIFEDSQFYIALSRAKNPSTLRIDGTQEEIQKAIMSSAKALSFMHDLDLSKVNTSKEVLQNAKSNLQSILQKESVENREQNTRGHLQQASPTASNDVKNSRDAKLTKPSIAEFGRDTCSANTEAVFTRLGDVQSVKERSYRDTLETFFDTVARAAANRERNGAVPIFDVKIKQHFDPSKIVREHGIDPQQLAQELLENNAKIERSQQESQKLQLQHHHQNQKGYTR
ncbi:MAG: hypothetical protein RL154_1353, partial [Pseudomonadota bacterium]